MSDLTRLAVDLRAAAVGVQREALAITEHAAVNVKKDWQDNARASAGTHAPSYPDSISYDMSVAAGVIGLIQFEVGPDKTRRQGALGNLIEYGSVNNPPHNDGGRALAAEAPRLETALGVVAARALW